MRLPRLITITLALLIAPLLLGEIGIGDSRDAVLQQAGPPTSRAKRGDREIFLYPRGGRVEFAEGKVVDVKGPLPVAAPASAPDATAPAETAEPSAPAATTTPSPAAGPVKPATPVAPAAKPARPAGDSGDLDAMPSSAAVADALGKHIEKMDTAWGERPAPPPPESAAIFWVKILVLGVLHFGITIFALRVAFKIEEMDAFWKGVLAIAGIDLAVYLVLELLGPVSGGIANSSGVQGGIGALVMVFTIQKFCFNKRLQNAVITAMSVKLVVQLCHIFAFVFLLNALFG